MSTRKDPFIFLKQQPPLLSAKKYPLITYEKALLSQATGGKFPSVTFIERKQMSTKTSIKRIALVAAAALTLGGFSAVSANAAVTSTYAVVSAYSGTTTSSSQVTGGFVTYTHALTGLGSPSVVIYQSSGVGSIGNATGVTAYAVGGGTLTLPTQSFQISATSTNTETITVTSAVAGTQTITATVLDANGTPTSSSTETVTWIASSATGVSAANSSLYFTSDGECFSPSATGNKAADAAGIGALTNTVTSLPKSTAWYGCWIARDANNNLISIASGTVFTSFGTSDATNTGTSSATADLSSAITGAGTVNALLTDGYGNTITLTAAFTSYGTMSTLSVENISYVAKYAGADDAGTMTANATATHGDGVGVSTSALGLLHITAKDSAGATINAQSSATLSSPKITVTSDANPTVSVSTGGSNSAGATVAYGADSNTYIYTNYGVKGGTLVVDCHGSTKAEKLSIVFSALKSDGTRISAAPVTFYCSSSAKTVAVTAASSSVDAGAVTTVTATVSDAQGYPAPDGTAVTFAATGAGAVAPSTGSTWNGVAGTTDTNLVNFIAAGDGGSATVTAIAGNYSGSTSISVAGGSGSSSLSLDAANAATDAANNAYDEAQNATQAASDALAAVTALSAQVSALIATVKSLAAMVAKIKAKVKA